MFYVLSISFGIYDVNGKWITYFKKGYVKTFVVRWIITILNLMTLTGVTAKISKEGKKMWCVTRFGTICTI